ncbi:MAG: isoamylase early set domain-containing protein [Saprospiraceae bacterium]|nr:isoamylase early set domain-containing protein [Saprospiraceae bacterium]MCB9326799.1 isoamylase early set domain-containing protein [Lewinellaceae bacterium]
MIKKQYSKSKSLCKVTFTLPKEAASDAKEVRILGEFNDWNWEKAPAMKADKKEFKATLELATGRPYQFRYMIDHERWENDWNADDYVISPFTGAENSVVIVEEKLDVAPVAKKAAPAKKAPAAKKATTEKKAAPTAKATPVAPVAKATPVAKKAPATKVVKAKVEKTAKATAKGGKNAKK